MNLRDRAIVQRAKAQGIPLEKAVEEEWEKVGAGLTVSLGLLVQTGRNCRPRCISGIPICVLISPAKR